jgi:hypothetical protein
MTFLAAFLSGGGGGGGDATTSLVLPGNAVTDDAVLPNPAANIVRIVEGAVGGELDLYGLTPGSRQRLTLINTSDKDFRLFPEELSSADANRFAVGPSGFFGGQTDEITVRPHESVNLTRDTTAQRWRIARTAGAEVDGLTVALQFVGGSSNFIANNQIDQDFVQVDASSGTGPISLTGVGFNNRQKFKILNVDSTENVILVHGGTGSQFVCPGGLNVVLAPGDIVDVQLRHAENGWVVG